MVSAANPTGFLLTSERSAPSLLFLFFESVNASDIKKVAAVNSLFCS